VTGAKRLTIAYTPDSDDAFYYFALETGRVSLPGYELEFYPQPICLLNRVAPHGVYDVTAVSSVLYPRIPDQYAILSVGTSVGRDYGPVLVSKRYHTPAELNGRRVGVGGIPTTGWFLLGCLCPEAIPVEMDYDRIGEAVTEGTLDAGVMIHEELLYYPRLGLHPIADLGQLWCRQNRLPLPVGLNVIRRSLGQAEMERICASLRASLLFGLEHRAEALAWIGRFGRGPESQCTGRFVEMFANQDSVHLPADVREALRVLCWEVVEQGLAPTVPPFDIIEGVEEVPLSTALPSF